MRTYDQRELATRLTSLEKFILAPAATRGDTTVAGTPVAVGDTTVHVAAITNFDSGSDVFLVGRNGDFEVNTIASAPSAGVITLVFPTLIALPIGARVVEATRVDLGALGPNGVTLKGSATNNPIKSASSRVPIGYFLSDAQLGGSADLGGMNTNNLETVFSATETAQGAGTAAAPYQTVITGAKIGTEGLLAFRARGLMNDNLTQFMFDFGNVTPVPNVSAQLGSTNAATLGLDWQNTSLGLRVWT